MGLYAENVKDNNIAGGLNVQADLIHRIEIPQIIYFRVGSATPGNIDEVTIDFQQSIPLTLGTTTQNSSISPLGDSNSVSATANGAIIVDLRSNVGTISITYAVSNPLGLADGSGNFISFDEIGVQSSSASFPTPVLDNAASGTAAVTGNLFGGKVVNRQAVWTYSYLNTVVPVAGTYDGQITYTVAAL